MTCQEIYERIWTEALRECSPAVRNAIDSHASQCPRCRSALRIVEDMTLALNRLEEPEPARELSAAIMARVARLPAARRIIQGRRRRIPRDLIRRDVLGLDSRRSRHRGCRTNHCHDRQRVAVESDDPASRRRRIRSPDGIRRFGPLAGGRTPDVSHGSAAPARTLGGRW